MPLLIPLKTFDDGRGVLTVMEKEIPFEIRRIFWIYPSTDSVRGGHRHVITRQAVICVKGSCTIRTHNGNEKKEFRLDNPSTCLLLEPSDWHQIQDFSPDTILMILASAGFDPNDYIFDSYV